jgi:hypothetical protein
MATTPTYSWPIPDDTDLVKDGAKAIRDLGNAVDATVSSVPTGLVHINTTTFSAVSAVNVNDVFSSTYISYRILLNDIILSTSTSDLTLRFRASGSDKTGSNYYYATTLARADADTLSGTYRGNPATSIGIGGLNASLTSMGAVIDVHRPFLNNKNTTTNHIIIRERGSGFLTGAGSGWFDLNDSLDGFSIISSFGTMTGQISIYGYRN